MDDEQKIAARLRQDARGVRQWVKIEKARIVGESPMATMMPEPDVRSPGSAIPPDRLSGD